MYVGILQLQKMYVVRFVFSKQVFFLGTCNF